MLEYSYYLNFKEYFKEFITQHATPSMDACRAFLAEAPDINRDPKQIQDKVRRWRNRTQVGSARSHSPEPGGESSLPLPLCAQTSLAHTHIPERVHKIKSQNYSPVCMEEAML